MKIEMFVKKAWAQSKMKNVFASSWFEHLAEVEDHLFWSLQIQFFEVSNEIKSEASACELSGWAVAVVAEAAAMAAAVVVAAVATAF